MQMMNRLGEIQEKLYAPPPLVHPRVNLITRDFYHVVNFDFVDEILLSRRFSGFQMPGMCEWGDKL